MEEGDGAAGDGGTTADMGDAAASKVGPPRATQEVAQTPTLAVTAPSSTDNNSSTSAAAASSSSHAQSAMMAQSSLTLDSPFSPIASPRLSRASMDSMPSPSINALRAEREMERGCSDSPIFGRIESDTIFDTLEGIGIVGNDMSSASGRRSSLLLALATQDNDNMDSVPGWQSHIHTPELASPATTRRFSMPASLLAEQDAAQELELRLLAASKDAARSSSTLPMRVSAKKNTLAEPHLSPLARRRTAPAPAKPSSPPHPPAAAPQRQDGHSGGGKPQADATTAQAAAAAPPPTPLAGSSSTAAPSPCPSPCPASVPFTELESERRRADGLARRLVDAEAEIARLSALLRRERIVTSHLAMIQSRQSMSSALADLRTAQMIESLTSPRPPPGSHTSRRSSLPAGQLTTHKMGGSIPRRTPAVGQGAPPPPRTWSAPEPTQPLPLSQPPSQVPPAQTGMPSLQGTPPSVQQFHANSKSNMLGMLARPPRDRDSLNNRRSAAPVTHGTTTE